MRMRFTNMRVYGFLAWEAQTAINLSLIHIFADEIGADGYSKDAAECVKLV